MEKERPNKVEIICETTVVSVISQDENGVIEKEVTKTITNRTNLEGMSEEFLMDYFGLKVTIDWDESGKRKIPPKQD